MTTYQEVVAAWDRATPGQIHPLRSVSEEAYWSGGARQAQQITDGLRSVGIVPPARVLDFGCGDGRVAAPMARLGWQVVAADTSPAMLRRVQEHGLPIEAVSPDQVSEVDAAYCLAVLIHHSWDDGERLVAAIAAAVRPGGVLMLDWQVSKRPVERASWIGVTTWSQRRRDQVAARLGLEPIDLGMPWSTWRRS